MNDNEKTKPTDETAQRIAWKTRLVTALVNRQFDDVILTEMLFAALDQSHADGVSDSAHIVRKIAAVRPNSFLGDFLNKVSEELLALNTLNKAMGERLDKKLLRTKLKFLTATAKQAEDSV